MLSFRSPRFVRSPSLGFAGLLSTLVLVAACGRSSLLDGNGHINEGSTGTVGAGGGGIGGSSASSSGSGLAGTTGVGGSSADGVPGSTTNSTGTTTPGSSTSSGGACRIAADCDDGNACTTDACVSNVCVIKARDEDGDGHVSVACGGDDCNDLNPNAHPGLAEVCTDGADNDCNGLIDCLDPACSGNTNCGCKPTAAVENCTNGKDDNCDGRVDCNDPECQGTTACGCATKETKCHDGFDDDCDGKIDCADSDCASDAQCACQAVPEDCSNGKDDDCDGLVDCADPDCAGLAACTCVHPAAPEVCNDGRDNDCDGLVDCADPDCRLSASCKSCTTEICNDGKDNNCDGLIDCADPSCDFATNCAPKAEVCDNGLDDDHDGLTDCFDPDCSNNPYCVLRHEDCLTAKLITASGSYTGDTTGFVSENKGTCGGAAGEAVFYFVLSAPTKVHVDSKGTSFDSVVYVRAGSCANGHEDGCDDDSGNNFAGSLDFTILYPGTYYVFVDGFTIDANQGANQGPYNLNISFTTNPTENCDNGLDDDGDHYVDCADPDCTNVGRCLNCANGKPPSAEFGEGKCTDGIDNDCDGKVDCADRDCTASTYYVTECCNGKDANGDGSIDDFNCSCAKNSECPNDQICYTHTSYVCGIACDNYFGDICPYVASGTFCNGNTHQCEY